MSDRPLEGRRGASRPRATGGSIIIDAQRIVAIEDRLVALVRAIRSSTACVVPGFVDVPVRSTNTLDAAMADRRREPPAAIGVTAFCPTVAWPFPDELRAFLMGAELGRARAGRERVLSPISKATSSALSSSRCAAHRRFLQLPGPRVRGRDYSGLGSMPRSSLGPTSAS